MSENELSLKYNTYAGRLFLQTLGLRLEEIATDLSINDKLRVFNINDIEVGILYFENSQVRIGAKISDNMLLASYDFAKRINITDNEDGFEQNTSWSQEVAFNLQTPIGNGTLRKIRGVFNIFASADTEFGKSCFCSCALEFGGPNNEEYTVNLRGINNIGLSEFFGLTIKTPKQEEIIRINPIVRLENYYDVLNPYMLHKIKKNGSRIPYFHATVQRAGENGNERHQFQYRCRDGEQLVSHFQNMSTNLSVARQQIGMVMKDIDPSMFHKINTLNVLLDIGNIPFFESLMSHIYCDLSDEEFEAFFGFPINRDYFPSGFNTITDMYFGKKQPKSLP